MNETVQQYGGMDVVVTTSGKLRVSPPAHGPLEEPLGRAREPQDVKALRQPVVAGVAARFRRFLMWVLYGTQ